MTHVPLSHLNSFNSGLFSQLVRERDDQEAAKVSADIENLNRKPWERNKRKAKADFPLTRFARASVEGN